MLIIKEVNLNEDLDFISQLPDNLLSRIISFLSINEAARTSILSKRWIHLWKNVFHLDFDWANMIKFIPKYYHHRLCKEFFNFIIVAEEHAKKYGEIVNTILDQHVGDDLTSCCFKHFHRNVYDGDFKSWVEFIVESKKLSFLSLECKPPSDTYKTLVMAKFKPKIFSNLCSLELTNYELEGSILSAFESCKKLKILKLKKISMVTSIINGILENCFGLEKFCLIQSYGFDSLKIENKNLKYLELLGLNVKEIDVNAEELQVLVIDSLRCPPKGIRIYSRNLRNFSYACNLIPQEIESQDILRTRDALENCSDLLVYKPINIFQNLLTLSIDLDLNNIRDALVFSYILTTCFYLNTLELTIPVKKVSASTATSDDCALPFPKSMFWENREVSGFIRKNLKFVKVKGFTGKELEVSFVQHLIKKAYMMKKLHVICDSTIMDEAKDLQSLQSASVNLSILLESEYQEYQEDQTSILFMKPLSSLI
ncbi:F-box protein At1g80960-like [Cicer arietinum]|uniref:F-box protein At1g67390 n=1 Tax=Cicer arietinum TaxID=3827 RepID=A0A3Q7YGE0_CICAR|nr:putative F-box protein At1g67390 [Cicer arietinum]